MRAILTVIDPPVFDGPPSVGEGEEPVLVQALVSEPTVEALDEAVLLGLPELNPLSACLFDTRLAQAHNRGAGSEGSIRMRQLAICGVVPAILASTARAAVADLDHWTNERELKCGAVTLRTALSSAGPGTPYHDLDSNRILVPLRVVVEGVTVLNNRGIERNALSEVTCSYTDPAGRFVVVTGPLTPPAARVGP